MRQAKYESCCEIPETLDELIDLIGVEDTFLFAMEGYKKRIADKLVRQLKTILTAHFAERKRS